MQSATETPMTTPETAPVEVTQDIEICIAAALNELDRESRSAHARGEDGTRVGLAVLRKHFGPALLLAREEYAPLTNAALRSELARLTPRQDGLRKAREDMLATARQLRETANGDCGAIAQAIRWEQRAADLSDISPLANDTGALREALTARELFEIVRPLWHYAKAGTPDAEAFERSEAGRFLMLSMEKLAALSVPSTFGNGGLPNVYWSPEHGNFYDQQTRRGMGVNFYRDWYARRSEFPTTPEKSEEPVFYKVATMEPPSAPFAVLAIYPDRREGKGCVAVVKSIHQTQDEAEAARAALSPDDGEV